MKDYGVGLQRRPSRNHPMEPEAAHGSQASLGRVSEAGRDEARRLRIAIATVQKLG